MKRVGGLFARIGTRKNLSAAAWKAASGKRERVEVRDFFSHFDENVERIGCRIREGSWHFGPYREFQVRDTKTRVIHAPSFSDRVIHHAMMKVVGPVLEMGASAHSYACRKGFGQHVALSRAQNWTRRRLCYGKMDMLKYYDSVPHSLLLERLARRFRERRVIDLFAGLLQSYDSGHEGRGLPIGALVSQYLGNFYLDIFDRQVKSTGFAQHYLRYMDDALAWGERSALDELRDFAKHALNQMGLEMKNGGEWNHCERGIPFLGFVVYPDRVRLGRQGRKRLRRKQRTVWRAWRGVRIGEAELQRRLTSLYAHAAAGDDRAWRNEIVRFGEAQEQAARQPRDPRRIVEQHRQEVSRGVSQQEEARQPQPQPGLPSGLVPRHGGGENTGNENETPPDDVPCRSLFGKPDGDETCRKPPVRSDICGGDPLTEKARAGAGEPGREEGRR